jgi:hypothetical protein
VQNIGTPNIERVDLDAGIIHFRFHFFPPGGPNDQPGRGTINMLPHHYNKKKTAWEKFKSYFVKENVVKAINEIYYDYADWDGY